MLSCSIWFSAPSFWICGGLESRCVGRGYGADGTIRTVKTYVPETCRAKNTSIKLLICIKLAFHFISIIPKLSFHNNYSHINEIISIIAGLLITQKLGEPVS